MIDFSLGQFWLGLLVIGVEQSNAAATASVADGIVDEQSHLRIRHNIEGSIQKCVSNLTLMDANTAALKLLDMFSRYERVKYTEGELAAALQRIDEDIRIGIRQEYFYHYPRDMAKLLRGIEVDWKGVLDAFPSSRREIERGIDCYALGDHVGCVFHMMRVAELGLRTIARERGITSLGKKKPKPIEWGTWQEVFDAIEGQLKAVRQARAGSKRDLALSFYDTALSDLRTLRGLYRDPTMHFRETYDQGEAYSAVFRVKSLMGALATKLGEANTRKIRWGL